MPGILYHLSFAEEVYRKLAPVMPLDKVSFMAGNLIPDLATDKKQSHYRKKASVDGFFVPEMELVRRDLFVPEDSVKFGMFCHLYLDYYFIEEFLIPEFIWDVETMRVINPRNNKEWDVKTFFSHSGMYGAYTEINQLMVRDGHVSISTVEEIPEILPNTGLTVFDARREKTWKAELEEYLAQKKEYTGEIFDYNRLWSCIERIATQFVEEFSK
jgi:hypothetical protein